MTAGGGIASGIGTFMMTVGSMGPVVAGIMAAL